MLSLLFLFHLGSVVAETREWGINSSVPVLASSLTSVLHPDVHLDFPDAWPCVHYPAGGAPRPVRTSIFNHEQQYITNMQLSISHNDVRGAATAMCTLTDGETNNNTTWWNMQKRLASDNYRVQLSLDGLPAMLTSAVTLPGLGTEVRLRGRGFAASRTVTGGGLELPMYLAFTVYTTRETPNGPRTPVRFEVAPRYTWVGLPNSGVTGEMQYSTRWVDVEDGWAERVSNVLDNDDETSVQVAALIVSLAGALIMATIVLLSIRRRLLPYLVEGSSWWASFRRVVPFERRVANREMEMNDCESQKLLTEPGDTSTETYEAAQWRLLFGDVMRPPRRLRLMATILGAGAHILTVIILATFSFSTGIINLRSSAACSIGLIIIAIISSPTAAYAATRVLVLGSVKQRRAMLVPVFAAVLTLPTVVAIVAITVNAHRLAASATNVLRAHTLVTTLVIWMLAVVPLTASGMRAALAFAPLPTLRINPIPRPLGTRPNIITIVTIATGLLSFFGAAIPLFFVVNGSWGNHTAAAGGLLIACGAAGAAVAATGTVLLVFLLLNAGCWNWWWAAVAAPATIVPLCILAALMYFAASGAAGSGTFTAFFVYTTALSFAVGGSAAWIGWSAAAHFITTIFSHSKHA